MLLTNRTESITSVVNVTIVDANKSIYLILSTLICSQIAAWHLCLALLFFFRLFRHFSARPRVFLNTALARGTKQVSCCSVFRSVPLFLTWWNCRLWVWWRRSTHTKIVFGSFWITWLVSEREGPLLASFGTALERLLLCGKHYDIMQVDLIDLMEHADMVFQARVWWEAACF